MNPLQDLQQKYFGKKINLKAIQNLMILFKFSEVLYSHISLTVMRLKMLTDMFREIQNLIRLLSRW